MFPGHGGQFVGMSRGLFRNHASARDVAEEAEEVSSLPLRQFAMKGPSQELSRPQILEPLLVATAISYTDILRDAGRHPAIVAGYSAGELAALYAAGVVGRSEAIQIAVWRGEILGKAAAEFRGGMYAVRGLSSSQIEQTVVRAVASGAAVAIAADNAPKHTTITGLEADLAALSLTLARIGGEVLPIEVAGPWHGAWLETAALGLFEHLRTLPFAPPNVNLYSGVSGRIETDPNQLRFSLAATIYRSIQWRQRG